MHRNSLGLILILMLVRARACVRLGSTIILMPVRVRVCVQLGSIIIRCIVGVCAKFNGFDHC